MKYPRTLHLPYSQSISSDDRVASDVSALLGERIVITEKLDGENQAITSAGVYARSHADFTQNPWACKSWDLFRRIQRDIEPDEYLFGENMYGVHSISYSELSAYFYLFGIRKFDRYLSWSDVEETAYLLDIPTAPVLFDGVVETEPRLKELVLGLTAKPSKLGAVQSEGCVVRLYNAFRESEFSRFVFKWVRPNHVQTDAHWTRNWKAANLIS